MERKDAIWKNVKGRKNVTPESSSSLRNSYQTLQQPFRKTNTGQNALSFIGPTLWNKVPEEIKRTTNLNVFIQT